MELLDAVEALVRNPLLNVFVLEDLPVSKDLREAYKCSNTHKIRELITQKKKFSDMSHVIPYPDMSHVSL